MNDIAEEQIEFYDEWAAFRTTALAHRFKHKSVVDGFVYLERSVFKDVKAVSVAQAMDIRVYLFNHLRINRLENICAEQRENYDPRSSIDVDDRAVCTLLEADLLTLQMQVNMWEEVQELFIPAETSKSKTKKPVVEDKEAFESIARVSQSGPSSHQSMKKLLRKLLLILGGYCCRYSFNYC